MRLAKRLGALIALIWTVLVFLSSVSPTEAGSRTAAWLNLPVLRSIPDWIVLVASSRWTLLLTALFVGFAVGRWSKGWLKRQPISSAAQQLGYEAYVTAVALDNMSRAFPDAAVISRLNLTMTKLGRAGYTLPPTDGNGFNKDSMSMYLHQVSTYLREDEEALAHQSAKQIVEQMRRDGGNSLPF